MKLENLTSEIEYWKEICTQSSQNVFYELAFFKIFVKFEQFMIAAFIHYATGGSSHVLYKPERKLEFQSLPHLEGVFIIDSKKYLIEKPESIEQLSKHIFLDNDNPFEMFFTDVQVRDNMPFMRVIRNYIAHGSEESLKRYTKLICNNEVYKAPYEYLLKKRPHSRMTNYTFFIDLLNAHTHRIANYNKTII